MRLRNSLVIDNICCHLLPTLSACFCALLIFRCFPALHMGWLWWSLENGNSVDFYFSHCRTNRLPNARRPTLEPGRFNTLLVVAFWSEATSPGLKELRVLVIGLVQLIHTSCLKPGLFHNFIIIINLGGRREEILCRFLYRDVPWFDKVYVYKAYMCICQFAIDKCSAPVLCHASAAQHQSFNSFHAL